MDKYGFNTVFAVAVNILLDFMSHQNSAKTDKSRSQSKGISENDITKGYKNRQSEIHCCLLATYL